MQPGISVVIPTKDRETLLTATLGSVFRSRRDVGQAVEVVVVNDGGQELATVADSFRTESVRIVPNQGSGAAAARNTGAAAARRGLLVFLDDDILLGEQNLRDHLDAQTRFPGSLVSGVARLDSTLVERARHTAFGRYKLRYDYAADSARRLERRGESLHRVAGVASFNLSIRREEFGRLNGFDARFPHAGCEDQEFSFRARAGGMEMLVDERIECYHNELDRLDAERWFLRQYTGIQGAVLLAHIYPEGKNHPVYRAFSPPSLRDPARVLGRKLLTAALAAGSTPRRLLGLVRVLERLGVPDPVLFQVYRALWVVHAHKGFREGLRRLQTLIGPI